MSNKKTYAVVPPRLRYAPWMNDQDFIDVYELCKSNTMVTQQRLYDLWLLVEQVAKLDRGGFLEVGTWKGGSSAIIAKKARLMGIKEGVHLCDTFSGVVKVSEADPDYVNSEHSDATEKELHDLFSKIGIAHYQVHSGIFPDVTADRIKTDCFRFCHIDVDIYESARETFNWVWNKMVAGGIVVFDDYGSSRCEGIVKFVNEELKDRNDLTFIYNLNGHAVCIKK